MTQVSQETQAPYPGLRSFRRDEFDIFFGRDEHVADMIDKLRISHFLCITGPSGSGKSSLARTGLLNGLEAGFLAGRGSDWIFCDIRPQTDPLNRLCHALAVAIVTGESDVAPAPEDNDKIATFTNLFNDHISRKSGDLNEALDRIPAVNDRPVVLLVDQFEEMFRYAQADRYAASRFVDVLLKTVAARANIYVVITIRTDELARCARYAGLTDVINASQFLTPTLDRFQMQEAIEGPISLFNGTVDPTFSVWLLNGLEDELDKLPLMQHALMLCYDHKAQHDDDEAICITLEDFFAVFDIDPNKKGQKAGRRALQMSLSRRMDKIFLALKREQRQGARRMFCALTSADSGRRDIRHPMKLAELADMIGLSLDETRDLIRPFSEGAVAYIRTDSQGEVGADDVIDVAHECILRLWEKLQKAWLPAESKSIEDLRSLAGRVRQRDGALRNSGIARLFGTELLSGYALEGFQKWWRKQKPTEAWIQRFLPQSESANAKGTAAEPVSRGDLRAYIDASKRYMWIRRGITATAFIAVLGFFSYMNVAIQVAVAEEAAKAEAAVAEQAAKAEAAAAEERAKAEAALANERAKAELARVEAAAERAAQMAAAEAERVRAVAIAEAEAEVRAEQATLLAETRAKADSARKLQENFLRTEARDAISTAAALVAAVVPSSTARQPIDVIHSAYVAQNNFLAVTPENAMILQGGEQTQLSDEQVAEYADLKKRSFSNLWSSIAYAWEFARFSHDGANGRRSPVTAAAFLPIDAAGSDNLSFVTLTYDPSANAPLLNVWDQTDGTAPSAIINVATVGPRIDIGAGRALAVAKNGTIAVGTSQGAVIVVAPDSASDNGYGRPQILSRIGAEGISDLAFADNGSALLAVSIDGNLALWTQTTSQWEKRTDLNTNAILQPVTGSERTRHIHAVDIAASGENLALGLRDGNVCLIQRNGSFDVVDWRISCSLAGHPTRKQVNAVRFDPSGTVLVSGANDDRVAIWNIDQTEEATTPLVSTSVVLWQQSDIYDIAFSTDGTYVSIANWDGVINVYERRDWRPVRSLRGHDDSVTTVHFDQASRFVLSASIDGTARIWSPSTSRAINIAASAQIGPVRGTSSVPPHLKHVAIGPNAGWVAAASDTGIWLKRDQEPVDFLWAPASSQDRPGALRQLVALDNRDVLFASFPEPEIAAFFVQNGRWRQINITIPGENVSARQIAINAAGTHLAVVGAMAEVAGYQLIICAVPDAIADMTCDADQTVLPFDVVHDRRGRFGACLVRRGIAVMALYQDRLLAVGGRDCLTRVYDLESGDVSFLTGHTDEITALSFSPDGQRIVSGSADNNAVIWDLQTGTSKTLRAHGSRVSGAHFSSSGDTVATVSPDERFIVWDADSATRMATLPLHNATIEDLDMVDAGDQMFAATVTVTGQINVIPYFETDTSLDGYVGALLDQFE